MTDGSDAVDNTIGRQLTAASVGINRNAVEVERMTNSGRESPLVRPNGSFLGVAVVGLAIAGIDNIDLINLAVVVPVVVGKVDRIDNSIAALYNHLTRTLIVAIFIIFAIIFHVVCQLNRSYHIESQSEKTIALGNEIVLYAANEAFVANIVVSIQNIQELFLGVDGFEFHISIFHQDDKTLELAN